MIRLLLALLLNPAALAGHRFAFRQQGSSETAFRLFLEPGKAKVDIAAPDASLSHSVFFFRDEYELRVVDHKKKTIVRVPRKVFERMRGKGTAATPLSTRVAALGVPVGRWSTTHRQVLRGEKLLQELWTVPFSRLELDPADFTTLQLMGDAIESINRLSTISSAGSAFVVMDGGPCSTVLLWHQVQEFPVKSLGHGAGGDLLFELEDSKKLELSPAEFALPKRYRELPLPKRKS